MKNVIILHGWGETPDQFWFPYVKKELEKRGYVVSIPELPNTGSPTFFEQMQYVLDNEMITEETVFIGHSSGCPVILSILEKLNVIVKQVIFIAGYYAKLKVLADETVNLKDSFDWNTIKKHGKEFIFINAANDPWSADDKQGRGMFDKLGGMLIINNEGHMGSSSYKQPYKEFPLIIKLID